MKKLLLTLFLFTSSFAALLACRCSMDEAKLFYFIESQYVFRAEVETASDCGDNNKYEYTLEIKEVYKGDLKEEDITVFTDCITSCSFQLKEGMTYIFFTDLINNNLGFCEYRIREDSEGFDNAKDYLKTIKDTRLDFLSIKNGKDQLMGELQVYNGKLDGLAKIYYPDGQLRMRGMFIKGVASGGFEVIEKKNDGLEIWTGDYKNGIRIGSWIRKIKTDTSTSFEYVFYKDGEISDRYLVDLKTQELRYAPKN